MKVLLGYNEGTLRIKKDTMMVLLRYYEASMTLLLEYYMYNQSTMRVQ